MWTAQPGNWSPDLSELRNTVSNNTVDAPIVVAWDATPAARLAFYLPGTATNL